MQKIRQILDFVFSDTCITAKAGTHDNGLKAIFLQILKPK